MFSDDFVDAEALHRLPFSRQQPVTSIPKGVMDGFLSLLTEMRDEFINNDPDSFTIIRSLTHALLLRMIRYFESQKQETRSIKSPITRKFQALVDKSYLEHYSVEQYAEKLFVTSKHLIETVKDNTGVTPLKFIHNKMISEAKRHLFYTDLSVKEIAD